MTSFAKMEPLYPPEFDINAIHNIERAIGLFREGKSSEARPICAEALCHLITGTWSEPANNLSAQCESVLCEVRAIRCSLKAEVYRAEARYNRALATNGAIRCNKAREGQLQRMIQRINNLIQMLCHLEECDPVNFCVSYGTCGHIAVCLSCAEKMHQCPMCRANYEPTDIIKTFKAM